jgi:hypothetical protein
MTESIHFSEEKIPQVVALIRRGLKTEKDPEVKKQLKLQCDELEEWYKA